ncbi:related to serum paraoxonase/arylesterase family protein [Cephalotrichum gorgonifer]|uniref:Related to serum paraoxonase/arylesterase family protein n=1 Tax=Cephalotrichum gorgonifer TaxID=2041049 RepID=A0AAE8MUS6_9PEZI|nr:related to serum paraoxonase/arylesterase family protein [Cephalotrichum gorgonifer]
MELNYHRAIAVALIAAWFAYIFGADIFRLLKVVGILQRPDYLSAFESSEVITIADTTHCEDLHFHKPSNLLFTACEDTEETRYAWFPPVAIFDDPVLAETARGSFHVIDPETFQSTKLTFDNFQGPFITHGIDVISDPDRPDGEAVYIFAVNHPPHPEYLASEAHESSDNPPKKTIRIKARSQLELFHHVIGTSSVKHIRSIHHPLITTPNDILALNLTSVLVTNDHYYREGPLRFIEDVTYGAKWSSVVHLRLTDTGPSSTDASNGVHGTVALDKLHNNNGLGRGRTPGEVLVATAASGTLNLCKLVEKAGNIVLLVTDSILVDTVADNPTYFSDPYATNGDDKGGFVLTGVLNGVDISEHSRDPSAKDGIMVWFVPKGGKRAHKNWDAKAIFADDGTRIRTSTTALLLAIDPASEGGKRKAWLWVTGFLSKNIIAIKVELE